ncbi:uncharacterized protein LOC123870487 [Maniola jurtina]|uniref:uncharacterized protein LOC123870487 n=1 Tax=Maniola jurtina TaxID=191418 RepID=UPI001E689AE3|nr:uncharacterized protein LOC123870487 [Maniola jurtina]
MKNMPKQYLIIIFAAVYFRETTSTKLSLPRIPHEKCSLKDSECLKAQVQKSVIAFSEGIPELGIENLSKMSLDSVVINRDGLIYEIRNVTVDGLKDAIVENFWIDTYVKYIHITFRTTYVLDCHYKADGYLFSFPVHGDGKAHIVKKNVITELVLLFDIKKNEDNKDFINLKAFRYGFDQQHGTIYRFENLFNGDKVKSDIAHDLVNRNWRTTSSSFGRFLFDKVNEKIFNAIKIYLKSFPMEDIAISLIIQYKCLLWDSPCLTASAQAAVPKLTAGVPELGIERLDTMFIDSLHIDQGGYKADWNNIYVQGLKNTIIDNLSIDMTSKVMRLLFHTDLSLKAQYVNNGFLLSLPVTGKGEVTMKLQNLEVELFIPYDILKSANGVEFIEASNYNFRYNIKDNGQFRFDNLYNGDIERSELMHTLLNQHWKFVTTLYGRSVISNLIDNMAKAYKNYFRLIPLKSLVEY